MLKLSSTIHTNIESYEETGSLGSAVFSIASECLPCTISSKFKVPGELHIISKMFGQAKVLKNFHLYRLDAHYLSLVEYA